MELENLQFSLSNKNTMRIACGNANGVFRDKSIFCKTIFIPQTPFRKHKNQKF